MATGLFASRAGSGRNGGGGAAVNARHGEDVWAVPREVFMTLYSLPPAAVGPEPPQDPAGKSAAESARRQRLSAVGRRTCAP